MNERTRKANGDSWIAEKPDKDGCWNAFVTMGTKPDGRADRRHLKRRKLPDLRKAVKELERKRDAGVTGKGKPPTVGQMLARRLRTLTTKGRAPNTLRNYESLIRTAINPRVGGQRIDRVLPEHIEDVYASMVAGGLGPASVRKAHVILFSALEVEFRRGNIARNPAALVEPPPPQESRREGLTEAQARRVIQVALQRPGGARWVLELLTGMRQGEILGAMWDRLDEERHHLQVWYQLQRNTWHHGCADKLPAMATAADDKARDEIRLQAEHACAAPHCKSKPCPKRCRRHARKCPPPCPADCVSHARLCPERKLPAGSKPVSGALVLRPVKEKRRKVIPLDLELLVLLRKHRSEQYEQKLLALDEWKEHGLMFCRLNGSPVDPRADAEEWAEILREAGIPYLPLHGGRHTAATIMIEKGIALAVVQEILGHSDIRVTRGYVHVSTPLAQDAAKVMGGLLRDPDSEPGKTRSFGSSATETDTPGEDQGS